HSKEGARITKLESDVATVNKAIKVYITSGGSFGSLSEPQDVLDKMKTVRDAVQSASFAGLRGSMIDKRLAARLQSESEAAGASSRAIWNSDQLRFVIAKNDLGVKEFYLDETLASVDFGSETRDGSSLGFDSSDRGWIWAYEDSDGTTLPSPTIIPTGGGSTAGVDADDGDTADGGDDGPGGPEQLLVPVISPAGGDFQYLEFPKTVFISHTNPPTSSWIMVSTGGDFSKYTAPFNVEPDTTVSAYVTGNPASWIDSPTVNGDFAREDFQLLPPVIIASSDQFDSSNTEITVTLTNTNSSDISSLVYWFDGGNADAGTTYSAPFVLNRADYPDGISIFAKAVGTEPFALESSTASKSLKNSADQLQKPVIALSSPEFNATVSSITITLTNSNPGGSSDLYYSIKTPDGAYPAVASWSLYGAPFATNVATFPDGFSIRTYAKSLDAASWTDSDFSEATTTSFFEVPIGDDVLFVIDASSSMNSNFNGQERFDAVIAELVQVIPTLPANVRFNVAMFDGGIHWVGTDANVAAYLDPDPNELFAIAGTGDPNEICLAPGETNPNALPGYVLRPATDTNKQAMVNALLQINNHSGTNYEIGLTYPLQFDIIPGQVIFLTDGRPNGGDYPNGPWIDEVQALGAAGIRVDCVGMQLGDDEIENLTWIATTTGGSVFTLEEGGYNGGNGGGSGDDDDDDDGNGGGNDDDDPPGDGEDHDDNDDDDDNQGFLEEPDFSEEGDEFDYDELPFTLTLSNENSGDPNSFVMVSINNGGFDFYTGPITIFAETTILAYVGTTTPGWTQSSLVLEEYTVDDYDLSKPSISVSPKAEFKGSTTTVTATLTDPNPPALSTLVYWLSGQSQSQATTYTGPFQLHASDWPDDVTVYAKCLGAESFVDDSSTKSKKIKNKL
ncbi:MAG: hypothetical protein ACI8UO_005569, partial [Verrucomicrobiales bacterium]